MHICAPSKAKGLGWGGLVMCYAGHSGLSVSLIFFLPVLLFFLPFFLGRTKEKEGRERGNRSKRKTRAFVW